MVQTLRLNIKAELKTMDPRKGGEQYSSQVHFLFFAGLVKLYSDGFIKRAQAESYELSKDNLQITRLRDSVWLDTTPVTAYDFEQSWKDILDPKFPLCNQIYFLLLKMQMLQNKALFLLMR